MTKTTQTTGRTTLARWKHTLMFLFCLPVITDTLLGRGSKTKQRNSIKIIMNLKEDRPDSIDSKNGKN